MISETSLMMARLSSWLLQFQLRLAIWITILLRLASSHHCQIAKSLAFSTGLEGKELSFGVWGCAGQVTDEAHQEIEDVGTSDGGGNVVALQRAALVLLRVVPRPQCQLQNEHLARLLDFQILGF